MTEPGVPSQEWSSFKAFSEDALIRGATLCVPVRFVWRRYLGYCAEYGFTPARAAQFMSFLNTLEGIRIHRGGKGRLRTMIVGATV